MHSVERGLEFTYQIIGQRGNVMEVDEWRWPARECGITAESQFLAVARSKGYEPEYFGGHTQFFDAKLTMAGTTNTVDIKVGFFWDNEKIGFMGRSPRNNGPQIRADYLGLVVRDDGKNASLYGDRLEFPEHRGIYLVPSQIVEELFARGVKKKDGVTPTGMNVFAHPASLEPYKVSTGTCAADETEAS